MFPCVIPRSEKYKMYLLYLIIIQVIGFFYGVSTNRARYFFPVEVSWQRGPAENQSGCAGTHLFSKLCKLCAPWEGVMSVASALCCTAVFENEKW